MNTWNSIKTALLGVATNKLRSALTMLGIIIGVASVIAMLALGNGARAAVEAGFRHLGADQVQINEQMKFEDGKIQPVGKKLTYEDGLYMPEAVPQVEKVSMSMSAHGKVRNGRSVADLTITGVTSEELDSQASGGQVQPVGWAAETTLTGAAFLAQGRFFTAAEVLEGAEVCVLGSKTALDLFGGDDPLDQTVWVNRERCLVIGVLEELEMVDATQRYTTNPNNTFFMPISTVILNFYVEEPSVFMMALVQDANRIDEAKSAIEQYLRERHEIEPGPDGEYEDDFVLTTRKDILGVQQETARTFSVLLAAMAAVSLGVGGIGIMNVMLVSVTERTREIGVRMAIGAAPADIILQFLLEAIMICMAGGLLGVAVGILSIPLAASLNQNMALLEPGSIPLALGVALLTGLLFGLYPALRAARLDPIEALGYE